MEPIPEVTSSSEVIVSGTALLAGSTIDVAGGAESVTTVVGTGRDFEVSVPLSIDKRNRLFVRETSADGVISPVVPLEISSDQTPPTARVMSPADGSVVFTEVVDVTGNVSDILSGFSGLSVNVNGTEAAVNVGQGTNGTFIARGVVLNPDAANTLEIRATDALGNESTAQATVFHQTPTGDTLTVYSGNGQTGSIHATLGSPLEARLANAAGQPLVGRLVTFEVVQNSGRVGGTPLTATRLSAVVPTDGAGIARASWRLGGAAGEGNQRVEATAMGADGVAIFCASAAPGPAAQINVGGGHNQRSQADGPAADLLSAWVSDGCNGIPAVPVTFHVIEGDGYLVRTGSTSPALSKTAITDSTGHARVQLVHGPEGGLVTVEATFADNAGSPAYFECVAMPLLPGKETTFTGIVLDNASQAIGGAVCELHVGDTVYPSVTTDVNGTFRIENIQEVGFGDLSVEGRVANNLAGQTIPADSFPSLHFEVVIVPEAANSLGMPILLPELLLENERAYSTTQDTVMEVAGMEGLRMTIRAGSMSIDGSPAPDGTKVSLNEVRVADIPMPLQNGATTPFAWTLQPGGAVFDPPVEIEYPNVAGLPAGEIAYFLNFDHDTGRFEIVATGHVTADGSLIESDLGSGISTAGWGGACPPYNSTGSGESLFVNLLETDVVCAPPGEVIEMTALASPAGGSFTWSGGTEVSTINFPSVSIYQATFEEGDPTTVTCTYSLDGATAMDSRRVVSAPEDITIDGKEGDIITVNAFLTGLTNMVVVEESNSIGLAVDLDHELFGPFSESDIFYFRPLLSGSDSITVMGRCNGADPGAELLRAEIFFNVAEGYSGSGPDRVTFGSTKLDVLRQQHRLSHLGFRSADGEDLSVDGIKGPRTRQAIGLFCAAVADGNSTAGIEVFTPDGQRFINAENAPRWLELNGLFTAYQFSSSANRWATSWLRDILEVAGTIHQPPATYTINDLSRSGGGSFSPHVTHRAGMDMDVEEPTTTDDDSLPWFEHHGGSTRTAVATGTGLDGSSVVEGDLIQRLVSGSWESSVVTHNASVPATWDRSSASEVISNQARMSAAYAEGLLVKRASYDRDELKSQLAALFAAQPASGARCGQVFWNDPFFYDGDSAIPGQDVRFVDGIGGHFQMNVAPPADAQTSGIAAREGGYAAHLDQYASEARSKRMGQGEGISDTNVLKGDWSIEVEGSPATTRDDGTFMVQNIVLIDNWGPGGTGTEPDGASDNLMRLKAVRSPDEGDPLYAVGPGLQVRTNEITLLGDLTISDIPSPEPVSIDLDLDTTLFTSIGETAVATVTAELTDGAIVDATGFDNFSLYTVSNQDIIGVDETGLVTARSNGVAFLRAVNEGVTTTKLLTVAGGDPLTSVIGVVTDDQGQPVADATVQVAGFAPTAFTNDQGQFFLENIPTVIQPTLTVTATKMVGNTTLSGSLPGITPNPGGITDAGVIEISDVSCGFDAELGPELSFTGGGFIEVPFSPGFTFPFFGTSYTTCFINSGGYITFGGGDFLFLDSLSEMVQTLPRVCPASMNEVLSFGGSIHAKLEGDRVVVTWNEIRDGGTGLANTFQVQLFPSGRILFIYNGMDALVPDAPMWITVTPGSMATVPTLVDYSLDFPMNSAFGEAFAEMFGNSIPLFTEGDGGRSFDLDQRCIEWTPNAEGGMRVEITQALTARYPNGGLIVDLPVPDETQEQSAGLALEVTSSTGRSWRKPLHDRSSRRSAFSHLPIPGSYRVRMLDGDRVLAVGHTKLDRRGEQAAVKLTRTDPSSSTRR